MAVEEFVHKTLDLLEKEREAEIQETQVLCERLSAKELERRGVCLRKLHLCSHRSGLYGRMVAVFGPEPKHGGAHSKLELPSNNFSPGDIVGVGLTSHGPTDKALTSGVILQLSATSVSVAFDDSQDVLDLDDSASYKLTKLANDVTYRRLKTNLNDLLKYREGPSRRLIDTLFCLEELSVPSGEFPFTFINGRLDESQREAVKFALTQRELAIIHGPPGTGKTTTVVEVILQSVAQGLKVLVTAPSNIAVDNLLERLAAGHPAPRMVRLGHPARLMPHLTRYSLDAVVAAAEETEIVKDVRTDIHKTLTKMKKAKGAGERRALRNELKHLRGEVSDREVRATSEVLARSQVVLSTLTSATRDGPLRHMGDKTFDLVVIDECSQALEAACWIGLLRGRRCVLAGDHLQLPPTIMSKEAANAGLSLTLMERLLARLVTEKGRDVVRMLTTQYRMHTDIMTWASHQLYEDRLRAHSSVATHLLRDLDGVSDCEETRTALLLVDTAGCDLQELDLPEEVSKGNEGEADVVATHVETLIKAGVKPADIAVIAPYNMQVDLLRARLCAKHAGLEVKSVDGFQGREKEAVVISMVRSNTTGEVGFLSEKRRINVAVTRARRHLAVVCDSDTVCRDPFIASLVNYMTDHGDVLSADQLLEGVCVTHHSVFQHAEKDNKTKDGAVSKKVKAQQRKAPVQMVSTEEKAEKFRHQLEQFVADPSRSVLDFPPSLNSHDRMVVHEVAAAMGLTHVSTGEGSERHIQVAKPGSEQLNGSHIDTGQTAEQEGSHTEEKTADEILVRVESAAKTLDDVHIGEQVVDKNSIEIKPERAGDKSSQPSQTSVRGNSLGSDNTEPADKGVDKARQPSDNQSPDVSSCSSCSQPIPASNMMLHELHCSRLARSNAAAGNAQPNGGGGARKKETNQKQEASRPTSSKNHKSKEKAPKQPKPASHVRKASEVLSNIPDDDFDALISTITALDGKCAYRKCKTLTTTLGRNCTLCERRFCLAHLTPEVHGCGQAAKEEARRTISREGVLTAGSGVKDKKPNAARRAQLESRMDKKKDEFSKARSRKGGEKKS